MLRIVVAKEYANRDYYFIDWKRQTFFSRMLENLYSATVHQDVKKFARNCLVEWKRLKDHVQKKDSQEEQIRINYNRSIARSCFTNWRALPQVKCAVLASKLQTLVVNGAKYDALAAIYQFAAKE